MKNISGTKENLHERGILMVIKHKPYATRELILHLVLAILKKGGA